MTNDLTPEAIRAARAILKWSMRDLSSQSGVSLATINAIENDRRSRAAQVATVGKLIETFRAHGVEVLPPPSSGARMLPPQA